jgi:hypothetical protein
MESPRPHAWTFLVYWLSHHESESYSGLKDNEKPGGKPPPSAKV